MPRSARRLRRNNGLDHRHVSLRDAHWDPSKAAGRSGDV
jgi:hypothetical protein